MNSSCLQDSPPNPRSGPSPESRIKRLVGAHLAVGDPLGASPAFILNIWWLILALNISPSNCTIEFPPGFVGSCFQFVMVVLNFILGFVSGSHPTKFSIM